MITHFDGHGHAGESVFPLAAAGGVAEENHDGIADKLVDSATVLQGDFRHLIKVVVEELGQGFWLHFFRQFGEAFDVGEENGEFLTLGFQPNIPFTGKDRLPHLG